MDPRDGAGSEPENPRDGAQSELENPWDGAESDRSERRVWNLSTIQEVSSGVVSQEQDTQALELETQDEGTLEQDTQDDGTLEQDTQSLEQVESLALYQQY